MAIIVTYRDLDAWQQAMDLVEVVLSSDRILPHPRTVRSGEPLRRAAVSIPSNLAEGYCRRSTKAYANHVSIALGSHGELETRIELGARLGFLKSADKDQVLKATDSVGRLLSGLHAALERKLS